MSSSSPSSTPHDVLEAFLWDLRSQAEAKLRCLTRVQQLLAEHKRETTPDRAAKRAKIITDLTDVVTITSQLQTTSAEALAAAHQLV